MSHDQKLQNENLRMLDVLRSQATHYRMEEFKKHAQEHQNHLARLSKSSMHITP